jgi:predicted nuclease of restriction endonuclease-like RecB superfamily
MFKSKLEEIIADFYKMADKYETEKIEYVLKNTYTPDFCFSDANTYVEVKGFWKPSDRRKMLEVIKQYPNKKFIMFFQDSTIKITKRSKTTYGDWCDKNKITWFCWKTKRPSRKILTLAIANAPN